MAPTDDEPATIEAIDVDAILDELGFEAASNVLTRRQATVLVLRERGFEQGQIASYLGCSRANVSNIEGSARDNLERAKATVAFADLLAAPVRVDLPAGVDLYDVPQLIYEACDAHDIKVRYGAPELIRTVRDGAPDHIAEGTVTDPLTVRVSGDGTVSVRHR